MNTTATLIFDIGKTTKKALVFDSDFHVLEEQTENFPETHDDEGFPNENLQEVTAWVKEIFQQYIHHEKYAVTHVNFSAYGASFVHLDESGDVIPPFYNYLKPLPEPCKKKFLSTFDAEKISIETASPFFGLLNSGLQLYWLKHEKPDVFNRIKTSLHFPQYFPYVLGGKSFCDITSIGCHTMLWDFQKKDYHAWVRDENLNSLFPGVSLTNEIFSVRIGKKILRMGIGVHDSSAALMPYLATSQQRFLLLSTGTWNICFNPFNRNSLTEEELSKDCLCFLTWQGDPVKASRIFLGHEHEVQQKALAQYFGVHNDRYKTVSFNEAIYQGLKRDDSEEKEFYPLDMEGTGPLPKQPKSKTNLPAFQSFEEAQHQLNRFLAQWQKLSIDLVDPGYKIRNVFVAGGFAKSPLFLEIIKREIPERNFIISNHPRATALGAACLVHNEVNYEGLGRELVSA